MSWRRWLRRIAAGAALLAASTALVPGGARASAGEWYADVCSCYWAAGEIYALWRVGVTDGWLVGLGWNQWMAFRPTHDMTRAEFAILLSKAFGVDPDPGPSPFPDVPEVLVAYGHLPVVPWLRADLRAGIFPQVEGVPFHPKSAVTREAAVVWLVHALDLGPFADALTDADVAAILSPFRDRSLVLPADRAEIAAAVRLGILVGYPDHTLQPSSPLKRGEAAALVYRSAWVRASADPDRFSPDGDGVRDATTITAHALENGNIVGWLLRIEDAAGRAVRSFPSLLHKRTTDASVVWNGTSDSGQPLPPGVYFVYAGIESQASQVQYGVRFPVTLEKAWLEASLESDHAPAGGTVGVAARTAAQATGVRVAAFGGQVPLAPAPATASSRSWSKTLAIPSGTPPGVATLTVTAAFPDGATRRVVLHLTVTPPAGSDSGKLGREDVVTVLTGP